MSKVIVVNCIAAKERKHYAIDKKFILANVNAQ